MFTRRLFTPVVSDLDHQFIQNQSDLIMTRKGGLAIPTLDFLVEDSELITIFDREFDESIYSKLENLYIVCIIDRSSGSKRVVGGFFTKTNYSHRDKEFTEVLMGLISLSPTLDGLAHKKASLHPARLGVLGDTPLSEDEMLRIIATQNLKLSESGTA